METFKTVIKVLLKYFGYIMKLGFVSMVLIFEAVEFKKWIESDED